MRFSGSILVASLVLSGGAAAANYEPTFEITPMVGYRMGGDFTSTTTGVDPELDSGLAYGLAINFIENEGAYYELLYSKQDTELSGVTPFDVSVEYLHIGGILQGGSATSRVLPYFGLTLGATRLSPKPSGLDSKTKFSFAIAGGAKVPLTQSFALRFDVRGFATSLDSDSAIFCASSGAGLGCDIRVKSDLLIQGQAWLGLTYGIK